MEEKKSLNFLEDLIESDLAKDVHLSIKTRFPPEPNGYLHIGHAKSICLNFGLAAKYKGLTNLRFDDTNPTTESEEYVQSIKTDVQWLGFSWDKECYASDYFETLFQFALSLIEKGLAYVDDSSPEEIATQKGSPTVAGVANVFRERTVEENKQLFIQMRSGKFEDGAKVLRAKIDLENPNMHLRDPVMYRIKHAYHHRTKNSWCIYPMYDFAHGQSDSIENITHSICTLEFVPHRPLYDWYIDQLGIFNSRQFEFARLNLSYTVVSKRKLLQLVTDRVVDGWNDPRMPTLSGLRRRGYTAKSIRLFCEKIGIQKRENLIDVSLLEFCIREELNKTAARRMVVLNPIKLVITNLEPHFEEWLPIENNPELPDGGGLRNLLFKNELWIEADDFMETPSKKYFRLAVGLKVRLKSAYIITCTGFEKNEQNEITTVYATYEPNSRSGSDTSGLVVKGTIHWVSVADALPITANLYDRLFTSETPDSEEQDFTNYLNPKSLVVTQGFAEPSLGQAKTGEAYQFIRKGYFCLDEQSTSAQLVFNRTVTLKDSSPDKNKK